MLGNLLVTRRSTGKMQCSLCLVSYSNVSRKPDVLRSLIWARLLKMKSSRWILITASSINCCWSGRCADLVQSKPFLWKLTKRHTDKQHTMPTLSVLLIRLFLFAVANLCFWLSTTSLWGLRSFSAAQVFSQPIVPWYMTADKPPISHIIRLNDTSCLWRAVTHHDRTVCMLPPTLVMVSSAGWCHNSSMLRL